MFDTHIKRTEYIPYEKTIIEKRAPTDDSIRIYEEIKEKAYNSILGTLEVNNNIFNVKAIYYKEHYSFSFVCEYICKINDLQIQDKIINRLETMPTRQDIYENIVKHASVKIAQEIIKNSKGI